VAPTGEDRPGPWASQAVAPGASRQRCPVARFRPPHSGVPRPRWPAAAARPLPRPAASSPSPKSAMRACWCRSASRPAPSRCQTVRGTRPPLRAAPSRAARALPACMAHARRPRPTTQSALSARSRGGRTGRRSRRQTRSTNTSCSRVRAAPRGRRAPAQTCHHSHTAARRVGRRATRRARRSCRMAPGPARRRPRRDHVRARPCQSEQLPPAHGRFRFAATPTQQWRAPLRHRPPLLPPAPCPGDDIQELTVLENKAPQLPSDPAILSAVRWGLGGPGRILGSGEAGKGSGPSWRRHGWQPAAAALCHALTPPPPGPSRRPPRRPQQPAAGGPPPPPLFPPPGAFPGAPPPPFPPVGHRVRRGGPRGGFTTLPRATSRGRRPAQAAAGGAGCSPPPPACPHARRGAARIAHAPAPLLSCRVPHPQNNPWGPPPGPPGGPPMGPYGKRGRRQQQQASMLQPCSTAGAWVVALWRCATSASLGGRCPGPAPHPSPALSCSLPRRRQPVGPARRPPARPAAP
jgi:hypothetical protein